MVSSAQLERTIMGSRIGSRYLQSEVELPPKKRYAEVERCAALIGDVLSRRRLRHTLRFKQLYHDRAEITGYCARLD